MGFFVTGMMGRFRYDEDYNQILIFSSDYLELPSEFVNSVSDWMKKNEIVPSKVRFIKVDNSINDITKEFNK